MSRKSSFVSEDLSNLDSNRNPKIGSEFNSLQDDNFEKQESSKNIFNFRAYFVNSQLKKAINEKQRLDNSADISGVML